VNVIPLAADSLGARSVATYVECGATRVLIDPGATLAPSRFNLPPADEEWDALKRANDRISAYAARASIVFVSHYHEEHFRYDPEIYRDRNVWAKDPARLVGRSQAERASKLWKAIEPASRLAAAEGRRLDTPDASLTASPPLPHGPDGTDLGYVVALTITDRREGFRFVHASDVQGPLSRVATAYLIRERPQLLYLSGPPGYLETRLGTTVIDQGIANLERIVSATGCRVIMDHHAVRDAEYRERFHALWETGQVVTAAGFLGLADAALECARGELWARRRKPPGRMDGRPAPRSAEPRPLKTPPRSAKMWPRTSPTRAKEGTTR
jgi:predicted metallo-beta-lactamase superfamily hydrolase